MPIAVQVHIASLIATQPPQHRGAICAGQQRLRRLIGAGAPLVDLFQEPWGEGQLVALARQGQGFLLPQQQELVGISRRRAHVVGAVEGAEMLYRAPTAGAAGSGFVGHLWRVEPLLQCAGRGRIGLDEIPWLVAARQTAGRVTREFVGDRLARQWRAVLIGGLDRVGEPVFRIGDQRGGLPLLVPVFSQGRAAPAIAHGCLLAHVAVGIHLQGEGVLDSWIGRIALVVIGERFAGVAEEHRMAIPALRLQHADAEILLAHRVGREGACDLLGCGAGVIGVVGIHLLAQHHPLEGAAGLPFLRH